MKRNKLLALLLACAMILGSLTGALIVPQQAEVVTAARKVREYGKPWINSSVAGMVTKSTKHNIKDDFNLGVNYKKYIKDKLSPGHTSAGTIDDVSDTVDNRLKSLMTDTSFTEDYAALVQEYYNMFLDWGSRNAAANEYLKEQFDPIKNITDLDSLTAYLKSDDSTIYGEGLFFWGTMPNTFDPDNYIVDIAATGLSLGDSEEYEDETEYGRRVKKADMEESVYVLRYAGYTDEEANIIIADALSFEKDIATSIITNEESNASDYSIKTTNIYGRDELAAKSPVFPLMDILDASGYGISNSFNLEEPEWLAKLNELYVPERVSQIQNYLLYHCAMDNIAMLDEAAYREEQRISREFNGLDTSRDDEYYAFSDTQSTLWSFVDRMYVKKYCSQKMKNDIKKLMVDAVSEYKRMLRKEDWLSARTRQRAIHKLNSIRLYAVYPDKWEDWSNMTFRTRAEGGSYQEANNSIIKAMVENDIKNINQRVDKDLWGTSCTDVNASYWSNYNRILVYAGILNGGVYNESMSEEEKMGSIGAVIGHEISHAFDPSGSQFDEKGRLNDWWTKADRKAFQKRANKLIAYYDSIVPFKNGQHYSGTVVQGEAVADMGGVKCMLQAASRKKNFDYDKFFRAYANVWYSMMTEQSMENIYMQNEHPIDYLRVNVTLAQFDEFQKTYNIKEGDGMYVAPKDRINVW